ncbi:MAG: carboxypeptidase regulatory-like domain-containing protein [Thermoanaerobaculia bacterium]
MFRLLLAFALLAAKADAGGVTATLLLPDGRPAVGAEVRPIPADLAAIELGVPITAGNDGRIELPDGSAFAFVSGAAGCESVIEVKEGPVRLPRCSPRSFRVVDGAGRGPAKDVVARCLPAESWGRLGGLAPEASVRLPASGLGTVFSESGPVSCRFLAPGPGLGALVALDADDGTAGPVLVTLAPEGHGFEAVVVDAMGQPVSDRAVRLEAVPAGAVRRASAPRPWLPLAVARSDARGRLIYSTVPGAFRLSVDAPDLPPAFESCLARSPRPCRLVLPDEARLEVRFVRDDQPLEGVRLSVLQVDPEDPERIAVRRGISDASGRAVVRGLSRALGRARLTAEGPEGLVAYRTFPSTLEVSTALGDWPLEAAVPARLTVVAKDASPITGASVVDAVSKRPLGATDAEGALTVLSESVSGRIVTVEARRHLPASATVRAGAPNRVVLSSLGRVVLTLRSSDGKPIREAWLGREAFGAIEKEIRGVASASGEISFDVPAGAFRWVLRANGAETLDLGSYALAEGEMRSLGVVELSVGAVVIGRVLSEETGKPVPGVLVTAQTVRDLDLLDVLNERLPQARTDHDGSFRVTGLGTGRARLFLEAEGSPVQRIDVDAVPEGTDAGTLFLEKGRPVRVSFRRSTGEPVPGVRLRVRPGGLDGTLRESVFRADDAGEVVVPLLARGAHGFVADAEGTSPRKRVVLDGTETELEWILAGTEVSGRLTRGGEPLPGVGITVRVPQTGIRMLQIDRNTQDGILLEPLKLGDPPQTWSARSDDEGRFRVEGVGAEEVLLHASGADWASQPVRLVLPARGKVAKDLSLGDETLGVLVVDEADRPVSGAGVSIVGEGGLGLAQTSTNGEGRAVFFLAGDVPVRAVRASLPPKQRGSALLEAAAERQLTIVLREGAATAEVSVLDPDGRPAPQARVSAISSVDGTVARGRTDLDGLARLGSVDEGSHRVLAEGAGFAVGSGTLVVAPGGGRAVIRLVRTGTLELRLAAESKDLDVARIRIEVLDGDGRDLASEAALTGRPARIDDRDRYVLPVLPPGPYRVRVLDGNRSLFSELVRIREGERSARVVAVR